MPSPNIRLEYLYGDRLVPCYAARPRNLDDMFRSSVAARRDAPAVEDERQKLSYGVLHTQANRLANALHAQGVRSGDRVVLFLSNGVEFVVALVAVWRLGAIAVPVGVRQSAGELEYIVNQCSASAIFFDDELGPRVKTIHPRAPLKCQVYVEAAGADPNVGSAVEFWKFVGGGAEDDVLASFDDQTAACLMYTSGTTGKPKGAVLTHLGFFHTAYNYQQTFGYRADDRMLLVIPGTHISGLLAVVVVMLLVGGCTVCRRNFKSGPTLETISKEGVTAAVMVPAMYNLIVRDPTVKSLDLKRWRIGHFGGAAMPEVTIAQLADLIPSLELFNGFGATETTSAVTLTPRGEAAKYPKSVGKILPCVDIRIINSGGDELQAGEAGELWIRSPGNAREYWDNAEATRASFVAGYWRSGDIGVVESDGNVYVFDRIKDMIVRGGYKIYCVELENELLAFPGVIEAAVVASPCPVLGERIHAFLHATEAIDSKAVQAFCGEQLADYKTPDFVTVSPTPLPRNLNGKLVKASLREQAKAMAAVSQ